MVFAAECSKKRRNHGTISVSHFLRFGLGQCNFDKLKILVLRLVTKRFSHFTYNIQNTIHIADLASSLRRLLKARRACISCYSKIGHVNLKSTTFRKFQ